MHVPAAIQNHDVDELGLNGRCEFRVSVLDCSPETRNTCLAVMASFSRALRQSRARPAKWRPTCVPRWTSS